ncbi:glycosyltransferase family 4 protein [Crenothrix polyspora]|uniref:Glycosyltransferase n=1 Tax=Crenothrix polyspora TaxID=360316 RepID=A0A1R4HCV7_9GAMM|nr:glycosyltransferase family 4 protein [Crenothrix polyspora]SJM94062.1 Glycosyltransferase [Crenothrix polyspora]
MNILHVFRSPVGGLFRHVCDLAEEQARLGYNVGIICDASTGGNSAASKLDALQAICTLGVHRVPMSRHIGFSDIKVLRDIPRLCAKQNIDVVHGHGAKGGAYGRIMAKILTAKAIYTPHGGSMHYSITTPTGMFYLSLERYLKKFTDGIIFDSKSSAETYRGKMGGFSCEHRIVHNGLRDHEFNSLNRNTPENQFVFVGEIRKLKGLDILLQALTLLKERNVSLLVFGAGPDEEFFKHRVKELNLTEQVTFNPPIFPVTKAFINARCVVVPSLAESFPYIVLETAAAKVPLLTTNVGGIPEIFGPHANQLLPAGNAHELAKAMQFVLDDHDGAEQLAAALHKYVYTHFRFSTMVEHIIAFYRELLSFPIEIPAKS